MTVNPYDPRFRSFRSDIHPAGLDLRRSVINSDPGIFVADPNATFCAGQILSQNLAGNLVVCDGLAAAPQNIPLGFAKWNKTTQLYAAVVDEPVVLTGAVVSNLKHSNIQAFAGGLLGIKVASAISGTVGLTVYTEGANYTCNYTNGTLVRVGAGIPSGSTVYCSYSYALTASDLEFQGRNFWNFTDDVTIQQGRITVITDWAILFTTMYDHSLDYAIGDNLLVDTALKAGRLTNAAMGGPVFGRVFQLPNSDDPFLGVVTPGHTI